MNTPEQTSHESRDIFQRTSAYMSLAMQEVATELGGEDFAAKIAEAEAAIPEPDSLLPNIQALQLFGDHYPGSEELVLKRMLVIATEKHQEELAEMRKHKLRRYGGAILTGFASIGKGMSQMSIAPRIRSSRQKKS